MTRRLVDSAPISPDVTTIRIRENGPVITVGANQPIVWISVTPIGSDDRIPTNQQAIPAAIDTGFNRGILINETHLEDWLGIGRDHFLQSPDSTSIRRIRPAGSSSGLDSLSFQVPSYFAFGWLWGLESGCRDQLSDAEPKRLFLDPGVLICEKSHGTPRIPLLGMHAIAHNYLQFQIERQKGDYSARFSIVVH